MKFAFALIVFLTMAGAVNERSEPLRSHDAEFSECAQDIVPCAKLVLGPSEKIFILPDETLK